MYNMQYIKIPDDKFVTAGIETRVYIASRDHGHLVQIHCLDSVEESWSIL